jgi:hypothetical protein
MRKKLRYIVVCYIFLAMLYLGMCCRSYIKTNLKFSLKVPHLHLEIFRVYPDYEGAKAP